MQAVAERHIAVCSNPLAGAGRAKTLAAAIVQELTKRNIPHVVFSEKWPPGFNTFTDVWIVGGDGTLNYFINHFPGTGLPLVIFKGGTGNDFHWLLYGKKTFDEQLQLALEASPRPVDIGRCNERYFINGVGIGFEGEVARALTGKKKLPGKTSFLFTILRKIFTYRSKNYSIRFNGQLITGKKLLVDISNGRRAGGGFHIAPQARADDGWLDLVIAEALTPLERLRYLPVIEKGKHPGLPFIITSRVKSIIIETDRTLQYHLDGEYAESDQLSIEILPARILMRY